MAKLFDSLKESIQHLRPHKKSAAEDGQKDEEQEQDESKTKNLDSIEFPEQPDLPEEGEGEGNENDTGEIDYSDDENDKEKAKGVKKNAVLLGCGAIGVCLVAAVMGSALGGTPVKKQDPPLSSSSLATKGAQNGNDPTKGIPDKYSEISKYSSKSGNNNNGQKKSTENIKPQANNKAANGQTGNNSVYSANYVASRNNGSSNAQRNQSSGSSSYDSGASYAPAPSYSQSPEEKAAEKEATRVQAAEDKALQSAIAFSTSVSRSAAAGGGSSNADGSSSGSASTSTGNRVLTSAYSLTDGEEGLSYALQAGSVIQATLITGITTDVESSNVVAQVRQNIYDSQTGEHLLIPQGSRLIGTAGAAGGRGNARVKVAFTRLIYPDGHDIALPSEQAIDGVGYNGLKDQYTEHNGKLYGTAFVTALLSAAAQSATGNSSGSDDRSPGQEAVSGAVADVLDSVKSVIDRQANVQPTATIRPGMEFSVFITQDLFLSEYEE